MIPTVFKSICVGDLIWQEGRVYLVNSVLIGALGYEDSVEMQPLDKLMPTDESLRVPFDFIRPECIFRAVDHEAVKKETTEC